MQIGILECGPTLPRIATRHGTYPEIFARLLAAPGRSFAVYAVHEGVFPDGPGAADAWLLTGSRHGVYDPLPFIAPLERFVRAAKTAGVPMVGICFGHQIMAQALGGRVEKAAQGWGFGRQVYEVDGLGPMAVTAIHQDQVRRAPDGAVCFARNAFCDIAGLRYGDWGMSVQPHPEFGAPITADFIDLKAADPAFPPDRIAPARAGLEQPLDDGRMMALISGFIDAALGHPARPDGPADHVAASPPRHTERTDG